MTFWKVSAGGAVLLLALLPAAWPQPLPIDGQFWRPKLFELGSISAAAAATLALETDSEKGLCLSAGRWRAGSWSARFDSPILPLAAGRLTGWYRTEELLPNQASVWIQFYHGQTRVNTVAFPLAPAAAWTRFQVPVRRLPPDADGLVLGLGLADHSEGRVLFAGLELASEPWGLEVPGPEAAVERPRPSRPPAGGSRYRVEQRDGWWQLVSPSGSPVFSLGVDPPSFEDTAEGREKGKATLTALRGLGFNSLAGWHNLPRWSELNATLAAPVMQFRALETGTAITGTFDRLTDASGATAGDHAFPDPFDPRWETELRLSVRRLAASAQGQPWLVAWFADNERQHRDLHRYVWSGHCGAALRRFLEERYGGIAALNGAWGSAWASFDDLMARKVDPVLRHGRMYQDFRAFARTVVARWVETVARTVREEDPGRLLFSNRFMAGEMGDVAYYLDLYAPFDAIAVNLYPLNLEAGLSANERALLQFFHQSTGKPVLLTEWSIPALDSGLYADWSRLDWSFPNAVDTQQQRAAQAARVTAELARLPFILGAHWFIWTDIDTTARQANRGLFRADGQPWTALQQALAGIHRQIEAQSAPRTLTPLPRVGADR